MKRTEWYKEAAVYQIYPLSYMDSNNDGIGDIRGIISKLDYIRDLGVTAIWFSPLYASPWKDYGYDISDYKSIHPAFGTMEDFDLLMAECKKRGLRVIMDMVLNHTSDQHEWFKAAIADKDSPYRDYYIIRPGRRKKSLSSFFPSRSIFPFRKGRDADTETNADAKADATYADVTDATGADAATDAATDAAGELIPPTNWTSSFTGPAWQRIEGTDEYYLHLFAPEQPDLNWENQDVRDEIIDILKFWLSKGVDGFRFDVFNLYSKVYPMRDDHNPLEFQKGAKFFVDGPRMHEFLNLINEEALSHYDSFTVGESYFPDPDHAHRYIHEESGELDTIFDFEHLNSDNKFKMFPKPFSLKQFKKGLFTPQIRYYGTGWNTLVLENHDCARSVSRFGINTAEYRYEAATMLALITFMGWGTPFIYQGEEIGMTNVRFTSMDQLMDPVSHFVYKTMTEKLHLPRSMAERFMFKAARDNARVPMQWDSSVNAGFNKGAKPWQCVDPDYPLINVEKDLASDRSIYRFYQKLLAIRKENKTAIYGETIEYEPDNKKIVCYSRTYEGSRLLIVGNFTDKPEQFALPADFEPADLCVLHSNYSDAEAAREITLRPYEAILFEETRH